VKIVICTPKVRETNKHLPNEAELKKLDQCFEEMFDER